jgi:hypothetical protein
MSKQLLQVNFKLREGMDLDSPEGQQTMQAWVQEAAEFPGLIWKIWIDNEERGEYGGIYLFEDEQSLENYLDSDSMAQTQRMRDVSIKRFDIAEEPTRMTRGPIDST